MVAGRTRDQPTAVAMWRRRGDVSVLILGYVVNRAISGAFVIIISNHHLVQIMIDVGFQPTYFTSYLVT